MERVEKIISELPFANLSLETDVIQPPGFLKLVILSTTVGRAVRRSR